MNKNGINIEVSEKLHTLSLLCACLVVFVHVGGPSEIGSAGWWFRYLMGDGVSSIAVPYFFVVSGYFLGRSTARDGWYGTAVRKRIVSLLLPYCYWCVIGMFVTLGFLVATNFAAHKFLLDGVGQKAIYCLVRDVSPFASPNPGHLWYIRALFLFMVLSWFLVWGVRKFGVVLIGALYVLSYSLNLWCAPAWKPVWFGFVSLLWMPYFAFGIWLALREHPLKVKGAYLNAAGILGLVLLVLIPVVEFNGHAAGRYLQLIMIPLLLAGLWHWSFPIPSLRPLYSYAFPIYVLHMFVIIFFNVVVKSESCLAMTVRGLVAIVGSVVCCFVMRKTMPRLTAALFGGR